MWLYQTFSQVQRRLCEPGCPLSPPASYGSWPRTAWVRGQRCRAREGRAFMACLKPVSEHQFIGLLDSSGHMEIEELAQSKLAEVCEAAGHQPCLFRSTQVVCHCSSHLAISIKRSSMFQCLFSLLQLVSAENQNFRHSLLSSAPSTVFVMLDLKGKVLFRLWFSHRSWCGDTALCPTTEAQRCASGGRNRSFYDIF